jgi:hypothetical protein
MATKLNSEDIDRVAEDYAHFISNTYNNTIVLKSYIKALKEYADREKRAKDAQSVQLHEALRWIISGADSIPALMDAMSAKFRPLVLVEEKYTAGLHYADSTDVSGYFATIKPTRVPDIKINFPVDKPNFILSALTTSKGIAFSDAGGQIYFVLIYNEKESSDRKFAATLAKIYRSDGLAWSTNFQLPFIPTEILFKSETGELNIKGETQQCVVDKNGKLLKGSGAN